MMSTKSFNLQFWLLTLGLFLVWTVVLSMATQSAHTNQKMVLANHQKELRAHEGNCKSLCKQCGCMGFYCGEECICECNNENSDTECLNSMQNDARKLNIPFQLLVQGPSHNRFVQNAVQYSQDKYGVAASANALTNRNKRSTVLIYKPNSLTTQEVDDALMHPNNKHESSHRPKRGIGQLDWFNDIANTLVRPAPLSGWKKGSQSLHSHEADTETHRKRAAKRNDMDRSWFADNPSLLLRPAPLFKKQRKSEDSHHNDRADAHFSDNVDDSSYESPMRTVGKLPQVLKNTFRSLQETAIGSESGNDLGDTLRSRIQEGANMLQSQLAENNLEFLPTNGALLRDNLQQTWSQIFPSSKTDNEHSQPLTLLQRSTPMKATEKNKFGWFRPIRFLQRVQQAIN